MLIEFNAIGLSFSADVDYYPSDPGKLFGLPEDCYPPEEGMVEFVTLFCDGKDAAFLIDSSVSDLIYESAFIAARETAKENKEQAEIERYESRLF